MEITYQTNYRFQRSCLLKTYSLVGEEGNTHIAQLCTKPYGTEPHKEGELCGLEVLRKVLWKDKKWVVAAWIGGKFAEDWIHVYVWLSPFAVYLKLSQHC